MSTTGWLLYAPGDGWVEQLLNGPWTLEALTEPAGGWHGAFLVHSQEQPWEVERRLRTVGGHAAIPMLACYVETSDFGYALALRRGELVARFVVNAPSAEIFVEGVWALEQCVALHGRDWQQTAVEALASWSVVAPRPLTASQLNTILAGEHLCPEDPLFNGLGLALGIEAPSPLQASVGVLVRGEIPPEYQQVVVAALGRLGWLPGSGWARPVPAWGTFSAWCWPICRCRPSSAAWDPTWLRTPMRISSAWSMVCLLSGPRQRGPTRCWCWRTW